MPITHTKQCVSLDRL